MRIPTLVLAATAWALAAPPASAQGIADSTVLRLIKPRVDSGRNPGIVVGILEDGRTRIVAYGRSGAPNGALDGNTVFEIGSITKVFTGTLLALMAERGEVALDAPVAQYLPSSVRMPSRNGRQITLEDLSVQFSGLPRLPGNLAPKDLANPYADYTVEQMYAFLSGYELPRDPGAQFEYSNLGVGLLGHVLALRAGQSYEELVATRILQPLGMTDTRLSLTADLRRRLSQGHGMNGQPMANWDIPTLAGAGALRSTANDMLKFAAAALGGTGPLANAFAQAMRPRRDIAPDGRARIGLNWITSRTGPIDITWHNGGTGGYRSYLGLDPSHERAVIVLTNSANGADDIGRQILAIAAGGGNGRADHTVRGAAHLLPAMSWSRPGFVFLLATACPPSPPTRAVR
ncbi:MAG TPA: serine hydrolase domain-containing protein [Gemmatimonadaceae bacterium]